MDNHVILAGYRTDVISYLYYADALLLSSRYEGFPNIVLEAMAIGKPVFSNLCLGGINEIIINGRNGWACDFENQDSFEKGLNQFFSCNFSKEEIKALTAKRYDNSMIISQFATAFNNF